MTNLYNQFQSDVSNTANQMMTQMLCAQQGIDYNQLIQSAQMSHMNGILQAEQQKQMSQLVKRHYSGNSGGFMSKVKEVFSSEPAMNLLPGMGMSMPGMGMPMMGMPVAPTPQPVVQSPYQAVGLTPSQTAQFMNGGQSARTMSHAEEYDVPVWGGGNLGAPAGLDTAPTRDSARIDKMEQQMGEMQAMLLQVVQAVTPSQPAMGMPIAKQGE